MSSQGWIKLHRKILNNPVFQDPYIFKLWMYCLLKASHAEHKQLVGNEVVFLQEGQFIWGRIEASNELNNGIKPKERKSPSTWERHLKLLESLEMLNRETNNKYTIVTIVKWDVYQEREKKNDQQNEHQMNSKRTADEQQVNTNKNVRIKELKNDIKDSTTTAPEKDAIVFYLNNFPAEPSTFERESMLSWINDTSDELVIEAMKRSLLRNARNWGYVQSILRSWNRKGIKTVDQAKAEEIEYQNQQSKWRSINYKQQPKQEIIPDWFDEQKEERHESEQLTEEQQREQAEMEALLQKYTK